MSANDFLFASIEEVIKTLLEAFLLVVIVVYVFLQDFRSTLIPMIAIPVALIGTFFMLYLIGFSVNLLTLCAMVLAIAIVVDDAIVVVEGDVYKRQRLGCHLFDRLDRLSGTVPGIRRTVDAHRSIHAVSYTHLFSGLPIHPSIHPSINQSINQSSNSADKPIPSVINKKLRCIPELFIFILAARINRDAENNRIQPSDLQQVQPLQGLFVVLAELDVYKRQI